MKNNGWMPYYGDDFERPMKGYRREVKWSYLAALWHYWQHYHCQGLPNEDELLQLICDCPPDDWIRTKGVIFSGKPMFHLENGVWHQERARAEYREREELSQKRSEAAQKGVAARVALGQIPPQPTVHTNGQSSVSPSVIRIGQEKELDRVEIRLKEIKSQGSQCAGGTTIYTVPQKAEMKALRDRRDQLKQALGYVA